MDDKIPSTLEPQNQEPVSPSVSNTPPPQSPNSVQPVVVPGTVTTSAPTGETLPKKQKHWLRLSLIGLITVVVIGFGVTLAVNQDFRATVFMSKFETYTLTNSANQKYKLLFYRNATFGKGTLTGSKSIIGPTSDNGGVPFELTIDSAPDTNPTVFNKALQQCSFGNDKFSVGSHVYVNALSVNATICYSNSLLQNGKTTFDVALFRAANRDYFVFINQTFNIALSKTDRAYDEQILPHQGLTDDMQNDIRTIVSSIKPISV